MKYRPVLQLHPFELPKAELVDLLTDLWNESTSPGLAVSPRHFEFNLNPFTGMVSEGRLVSIDGVPAGFVLVSAMPGHDLGGETGWIDAIGVLPEYRRQGAGSLLLRWAEDWLLEEGCRWMRLGASPRTFTPGFPVELGEGEFFLRRGFTAEENSYMWDVARDLGDDLPIVRNPYPDPNPIRQAAESDREALLEFLQREFHGGWLYAFQEFMRIGGSIGDFTILSLDGRVEGFAWTTLETSARPLDRYHPVGLPKPWGQLGPIGVSQGVRKHGWGGLVLQAGLEHLRACGVRGCVIDWTGIIDFYGKYGFLPYRKYLPMVKKLI